jgi:hypothetical protein
MMKYNVNSQKWTDSDSADQRDCPSGPVRCFITPPTSRPRKQTADISRSMFARKMSNYTRWSSGIAQIPDS